MKLRHALIAGALTLALAVGAIAQTTVAVFNLSGNEVFRAQEGIGGTGVFVPAYVLRNSQNYTLVPTGTTVSTTAANSTGVLLATGAITTWNVTLPTKPYDGEELVIGCPGGTVSTLTIGVTGGPAGVTIVGTNPTSCTSGGTIAQGVGFIYSVAQVKWFRFL